MTNTIIIILNMVGLISIIWVTSKDSKERARLNRYCAKIQEEMANSSSRYFSMSDFYTKMFRSSLAICIEMAKKNGDEENAEQLASVIAELEKEKHNWRNWRRTGL